MDWNKPPTLKQFVDTFQEYLQDVGLKGPEGHIASHKIVGGIRVFIDDPNDDTDYDITGLELEYLMGCGCSSDIVIKIKKVENG